MSPVTTDRVDARHRIRWRLAGVDVNVQAARMPRPRRNPRGYYTTDVNAPVVLSLRPVGDHTAIRENAAKHGLRVIALSPWRIEANADTATHGALREALAAEIVIATSPAAARAAAALASTTEPVRGASTSNADTATHGAPLRRAHGQHWCAIGAGTARALMRAGIDDVHVPGRMDSEGLLALPVLADVRDRHVGLLTAPGGRDRIAPALRTRGARVTRADVYARAPCAPQPAALARLRATHAPLLLPLSSGEALERLLAILPADLRTRVLSARVLAGSERLAGLARTLGLHDVRIAAGPRPAQLLAAAFDDADDGTDDDRSADDRPDDGTA